MVKFPNINHPSKPAAKSQPNSPFGHTTNTATEPLILSQRRNEKAQPQTRVRTMSWKRRGTCTFRCSWMNRALSRKNSNPNWQMGIKSTSTDWWIYAQTDDKTQKGSQEEQIRAKGLTTNENTISLRIKPTCKQSQVAREEQACHQNHFLIRSGLDRHESESSQNVCHVHMAVQTWRVKHVCKWDLNIDSHW